MEQRRKAKQLRGGEGGGAQQDSPDGFQNALCAREPETSHFLTTSSGPHEIRVRSLHYMSTYFQIMDRPTDGSSIDTLWEVRRKPTVGLGNRQSAFRFETGFSCIEGDFRSRDVGGTFSSSESRVHIFLMR